ncbi:MAG: hypothetical protein ABIH70_04075 [Chloroflexota bacterium]
MLTREEVEEVKKIEGKARTVTLRTDAAFIIRQKGKEGLSKLEDRLRSFGYPVNYDKIQALEWCPMGLRVLSLLAIKDAFNWGDDEIRAMGFAAPTYSFVARVFMKAIGSPKLAISRAPTYWASHYDIGKVEVEFHGEGKSVSLLVKDFGVHPVLCKHVEGYLERVIQFVVPSQKVTVSETKCIFKGNPYHQYDARW